MRLKKEEKNPREKWIKSRVNNDESNIIQEKADLYTDGNVSEYLRYAALNFVPSKKDLEKPEKEEKNEGK